MPKKKTNIYAAEQADVNAYGKFLAGSRKGGFRYTTGVMDSIYGNLRTSTRGLVKGLTTEQARQLLMLRGLQAATQGRTSAVLAGTERSVAKQAGSVVGGSTDYSGVRTAAQVATVAGKGNTSAAGILAAGTAAAGKTMQQAVSEAQAGAQGETARALAGRSAADAAAVYQQQSALDMARLQAQLQLDTYRKEQAINFRYEQKTAGLTTKSDLAGLSAVAGQAVSSFGSLMDRFWNGTDVPEAQQQDLKNGDVVQGSVYYDGKLYPTAASAASTYISENGVTDKNAQALIYALSSAMYQAGAGPTPGGLGASPARARLIRDAINQQLSLLYPKYSKVQDRLDKTLGAGIASAAAERLAQHAADPQAQPSTSWGGLVEGLAGTAAVGAAGWKIAQRLKARGMTEAAQTSVSDAAAMGRTAGQLGETAGVRAVATGIAEKLSIATAFITPFLADQGGIVTQDMSDNVNAAARAILAANPRLAKRSRDYVQKWLLTRGVPADLAALLQYAVLSGGQGSL